MPIPLPHLDLRADWPVSEPSHPYCNTYIWRLDVPWDLVFQAELRDCSAVDQVFSYPAADRVRLALNPKVPEQTTLVLLDELLYNLIARR